MEIDPIEITGIVLIDKILDFMALTPDSSSWTLDKLKNNEPRLIRLKQIVCLIKLFVPEAYYAQDLKRSIENIKNGDFIMKRKTNEYIKLFTKMEKVILQSKFALKKQKEWTDSDLCSNYSTLLSLKKTLYPVINFSTGIIEISYPYFYSYIQYNNIVKNINFTSIDRFLSEIIDPQMRIFSKEELVKEYNYPDEDLIDVDMDYM